MVAPAIGSLAASALGGTTTVGALVGSALSAGASAWASAKERKEEEKAQIATEERQTARYKGFGKALSGSFGQGSNTVENVAERANAAPRVGQKQEQIGDRYRQKAAENAAGPKRYRFNKAEGRIDYG